MCQTTRTFAGVAAAALVLAALLPAVTAAQAGPVLALPITSGGASDKLFRVRLTDGSVELVERLRRDPVAPRARRLEENLFQIIGRPAGQAATPGEIFFAPLVGSDGTVRGGLLVESEIGYVAFFEYLG
jgi:hypothetical protein